MLPEEGRVGRRCEVVAWRYYGSRYHGRDAVLPEEGRVGRRCEVVVWRYYGSRYHGRDAVLPEEVACWKEV